MRLAHPSLPSSPSAGFNAGATSNDNPYSEPQFKTMNTCPTSRTDSGPSPTRERSATNWVTRLGRLRRAKRIRARPVSRIAPLASHRQQVRVPRGQAVSALDGALCTRGRFFRRRWPTSSATEFMTAVTCVGSRFGTEVSNSRRITVRFRRRDGTHPVRSARGLPAAARMR
jgi:hypothetical protein